MLPLRRVVSRKPAYGNPTAVHEAAFFHGGQAGERGPRCVRRKGDGHAVRIIPPFQNFRALLGSSVRHGCLTDSWPRPRRGCIHLARAAGLRARAFPQTDAVPVDDFGIAGRGLSGDPGQRHVLVSYPSGRHSGDNGLVIPAAPGTYALALRCGSRRSVRIGRLGVLQLRPGWYVYVGSAFGPGGLRARIGHHLRVARRPHWHVDYLRRRTRLVAVWYVCGARCEHEWAQRLGAVPGAAMPLAGFGSSDCHCPAHLFQFQKRRPTDDPSTTDSDYHKRPR